jgi:pimeloyl-ACP methyl ester carboxylesterase
MNSRLAIFGLAAITAFFSVPVVSIPLHAAVTILGTEHDADGHLRIRFTDTTLPGLYRLESRDALDPGAEWSLWEVITVTYDSPPVLQMVLPPPGKPHQFYRVAAMSGPVLGAPQFVGADPEPGADSVPVTLTSVRITFDRPMAATVGWTVDSQWGGSYATWSSDGRTVQIHRFSAGALLAPWTTLQFTLNPTGKGFADEQGNLLAPQVYSFTTGFTTESGSHVVSSVPANNAVDVDPMFDTVELRFSEPMMKSGGIESMNWWPWTMSWSEDGRVCYIQRNSAGTPLHGASVYIRTPSQFFRTAAGQPLEHEYVLRFTTAAPPIIRVDADPARGFFWPYYLVIPPLIEPPATLLIEPNNTGTWGDDPWTHESSALGLVRWRSSFAIQLGCPLLVPVFPRPMTPPAPEPGGIYIHALDRYSLSSQWAGLARIDLQMIAMIDDALDRLAALGHVMDRRVFMMGFSASGAFTSRFALLHPDRIKGAAPGSPGGWPLAPVSSWEGRTLKYPVGIADVETLTGQPFDIETFRQVPLYIYVGGTDRNDALDTRGMSAEEKSAICEWLDCSPNPLLAPRWPLAEAIYESAGANARFVIHPGVAHTITPAMFDDIAEFFREHR